jgi:ActR/RegA family two-component response regulator
MMTQLATATKRTEMPQAILPKILLVDNNSTTHDSICRALRENGLSVISALNVRDAFDLIGDQTFDVLLSDLHLADSNSGMCVVSAMRRSNPSSVAFLLSGSPEVASAVLLQANEMLVKPMGVYGVVQTIRERLGQRLTAATKPQNLATVLEEGTESTIKAWLQAVDAEPETISIQLGTDALPSSPPTLPRSGVSATKPAPAANPCSGLDRRRLPRTSTLGAGLYLGHDGRGIKNPPGQHLPDPPE